MDRSTAATTERAGRNSARVESPTTPAEAAELLRAFASEGLRARVTGGRTKLGWGNAVEPPEVELSTGSLDRIVEHNAADLTAVLQAGVPLAQAQQRFAEAGQGLALDPPLGAAGAATIGGIVAAADSGPLRHRFGAARDLLLGSTVVLSDGTIAKSGGKVIKNVAGYDLAKLFCGSFGTLGLIAEVVVRLNPLPRNRLTLTAATDDPDVMQEGVRALSSAPLELECLDLAWGHGHGSVMARIGGAAPEQRAGVAQRLVGEQGLTSDTIASDDELWSSQRSRQRGQGGVIVRVSARPSELARVAHAVDDAGATAVGRAGLGLVWVHLEPAGTDDLVGAVDELRKTLAPFNCVVLDAPQAVRERVEVWGETEDGAIGLMLRTKARFDPAGALYPGAFVGGI
jgi:glycolate oxidase FAD binding subunit